MTPTQFAAATNRAIDHLHEFGDTDLFPSLPEMQCYVDEKVEVSKELSNLSPGNYHPISCIETLTPKGQLGFRIAHQLSASDNIVYLAATIASAQQIESYRQDKDNNRSFAYRFEEGESSRLFETGRSFHDWINYIISFGKDGISPFEVNNFGITTDISDFYQRIYFHRIENMLADCECPPKAASFIKKLIQKARAKQSFGIPVGTNASRIIAEAILSDTDTLLERQGLPATRYVDDFRILVKNEKEAHSVLCQLAEHLMVTEGLSLNTSKTRIQPISDLRKSATKRLDDAFTSKELLEIEEFLRIEYGESEPEEPEDFEADVSKNAFMTSDNLFEKMKELSTKDGTDLSIYKAILRALRFLPDIDLKPLIDDHIGLLYYIPREFCLLIRAGLKKDPEQIPYTKEALLKALRSSPFSDLTFVRAWVIDLFDRGPINPNPADFADYDFNRSIYEKRYSLFLKGLFNDRAYFRAQRTGFSQFGEWEKPAVLIGAMCLPKDEYCTWIDSISDEIPGSFPKIFGKWLKEKHGTLSEIIQDKV